MELARESFDSEAGRRRRLREDAVGGERKPPSPSSVGPAKDAHPAQAVHLKVLGTKSQSSVKKGGNRNVHGVLL